MCLILDWCVASLACIDDGPCLWFGVNFSDGDFRDGCCLISFDGDIFKN